MTTDTKKPARRKTKKVPCDLDADFLDEVKDAVVFLQCGPAPATSIRSFVQDALEAHLKTIKRKHKKLLPDGVIPVRTTASPRRGRRIQ